MKNLSIALVLSLVASSLAFGQSGGGIGNGTDLYECKTDQGTAYELLDVYEARLRNQEVIFSSTEKAEGVLKKMVENHAHMDPAYAAAIFAEGAKVLSDIRSLLANKNPENAIVRIAEKPLVPGSDIGRSKHPPHCVPKRLIEQNSDPTVIGVRYEVDLDLVRLIDEVSLGISAYHEGLYKIVLSNGVQSSIGVRKIAALYFSRSGAVRTLEDYVRELYAAGIATYSLNGYAVSTNLNQYPFNKIGGARESYGHRREAALVHPASAFGVKFTRILFGDIGGPYTLRAFTKGAELSKTEGAIPHIAQTKRGPVRRADWLHQEGKSILIVFYKNKNYGNQGMTTLYLNTNQEIISGEGLTFLKREAKSLFAEFFSCWRNRLLRENVTKSDVLSFDASYQRLIDAGKYDRDLLLVETNECQTYESSNPQERYSDKSFELLNAILEEATFSKNDYYDKVTLKLSPPTIYVLRKIVNKGETCEIRSYSIGAKTVFGGGLSAGSYICKDFSGYTRKFVGVGLGIGGGLGVGFDSARAKVETHSRGRNAWMKAVAFDASVDDFVVGYKDLNNQWSDLADGFGAGLYISPMEFKTFLGVRVKSSRDEQYWIDEFLIQLDRSTLIIPQK